MDRPTISVVMPVHNVAPFLSRSIESILEQTTRDFEFIIIDDGSTDGSAEVGARYARQDPRVRFYASDHHGLVSTLNVGCLELATARYVARMDGDDVARPDRLRRQAECLDNDPDVGVVACGTEMIDAAGRSLGARTPPAESQAIKKQLQSGNPLMHSSIMMRRSTFQDVGGYRAAFLHAEDYDLWLRMAGHTAFASINSELMEIRYRGGDQLRRDRIEQTALSVLGARVCAAERAVSGNDNADGVIAISREWLAANHVPAASIDQATASEYLMTARLLSQLGEDERRRSVQAWAEAWARDGAETRKVGAWMRVELARCHRRDRRWMACARLAGSAMVRSPLTVSRSLVGPAVRRAEDALKRTLPTPARIGHQA